MKRFILIPAMLCILFMQAMSQEKAPGYYKIDIKQITPKTGINTGHVIAYGHYIRPPYNVEANDTSVFINNIRIYPPLLCEGKVKEKEIETENTRKWKNSEEYRIKQKHDMEAVDIYNNTLKETNDTLKAVKKAVKIHMKSGLYDSITFDKKAPKNRIKFWYKGWSFPVYYEFRPYVEKTVTFKRDITRADIANQFAESIKRSLCKNRIEYYGNSGEHGGKGYDIYKIADVLNDTSLTPEQKISELKYINSLDISDVYEIIDNYDKYEWENVR